jgi:hypothetical protein
MRKFLITLFLGVFALGSLSACGGKAYTEWSQSRSGGELAAGSGPWENTQTGKLLAERGYKDARAITALDPQTKKLVVVGAIYLKCGSEHQQRCANHYLTLATNQDPGFWVANDGTISKLQGKLMDSDHSLRIDVPTGVIVYADGQDMHLDWQHPTNDAQIGSLIAAASIAGSKYHSVDGQWFDDSVPAGDLGTVQVHAQNIRVAGTI